MSVRKELEKLSDVIRVLGERWMMSSRRAKEIPCYGFFESCPLQNISRLKITSGFVIVLSRSMSRGSDHGRHKKRRRRRILNSNFYLKKGASKNDGLCRWEGVTDEGIFGKINSIAE
jgi:hypothetical protein